MELFEFLGQTIRSVPSWLGAILVVGGMTALFMHLSHFTYSTWRVKRKKKEDKRE